MATSPTDTVEAMLTRLDRRFEKLDDGTLLVALGPNQPPAAVRVALPVVVVQVDVGLSPTGEGPAVARFYRRLLELNAQDLLHAAYGLDGNRVVLAAALELETMDRTELEAVLANVDLAIAEHVPVLRELAKG